MVPAPGDVVTAKVSNSYKQHDFSEESTVA